MITTGVKSQKSSDDLSKATTLVLCDSEKQFGLGGGLVTELCPTLDSSDCSPPGSSVHGYFPKQEYCSGLPVPPPGDLPGPGIKPASLAAPALQADSLPLSHWQSPMTSYKLLLSWL